MAKKRHKFSKKTKILLTITPIFALTAAAFLTQKIYAYNHNEYSANGIKYYDPDACNKDGGGSSTKLPGNTIDEKIWNYLISKGFNDAQAAGLMGNFEAESGNNPVREVDDNCWGIAMICRSSGQYESSRQAFADAGYGKYVGHPTEYSVAGGEENIAAEDIDGVLQLAIDWILKICDENSYIFDGTYTEWIKTAQTPEEAAEIFTVTYERPVCYVSEWGERCVRPQHVGSNWDSRYDGYQDLDRRREHARNFYDQFAGNGTSVNSTSTALGSGDGGNVTIIGDSITNMSSANDGVGIKKYLPNADIRSQGSKHMFMDAGSDNGGDSGATILADIVSRNELKDVLIIALGTNDPAAITQEQIQTDIIDKAFNEGNASKIIFVNNAEVTIPNVDASKYVQNNEVLRTVANANANVDVADWAAVIKEHPDYLNANDVHPNSDGIDAYGKLMYDAVGSLIGSTTGKSSNCNCARTGSIEGGLSEEQAELLTIDYNTGDLLRWGTGSGYDVLNNCVSFSKYIINVMTDLKWGGGNGVEVVDNLKANNPELEIGNEPRPFSIFSVDNHTGFIVAVNGDDVLATESAWPFADDPDGYEGILRHYTLATLTSGAYKFAYIEDHLKDEFRTTVGASSSVSTTSSNSAALVSVSWQDGWITQGIEGYKKEYYADKGITPVDNSMDGNYSTTSPKSGTMGPNKITLHSVEGKNESSGIAVYNSGDAPLSHFTIDLKNKKTYQHLPINKPACGVASHDDSAGVQIEIMGFSTNNGTGFSDDWYLQNDSAFGEPEWAYLAKLLVAISEETGIPLTSDVEWGNSSRLDASAFKDYSGVLGHMHVPDNSHTDPGDIWGKLSEQLSKVKSGKTDGTCNSAGSSTWSGSFPFLFQCEDEWAHSSFAGGEFCRAGCGVTSMSMVVSALTGNLVTPPELVKDYNCDTTASSHCLIEYADRYNLESDHLSDTLGLGAGSSTEQIKQGIEKYLKDGYIVIVAGHSGKPFSNAERNPFTASGHYVVFYGINENGDWLIADPAGTDRDWAAQCTSIGECTAHDNAMNPENTIKGGVQRIDGWGVSAYAFRKK